MPYDDFSGFGGDDYPFFDVPEEVSSEENVTGSSDVFGDVPSSDWETVSSEDLISSDVTVTSSDEISSDEVSSEDVSSEDKGFILGEDVSSFEISSGTAVVTNDYTKYFEKAQEQRENLSNAVLSITNMFIVAIILIGIAIGIFIAKMVQR